MDRTKKYYKAKGEKILRYANILAEGLKAKENMEEEKILESLRKAHKEWKDKERYFQSVTDEDLIDYAIYDLEASKMKYNYLLKKLKETNSSYD
ncbi:MAG: DUF2508 family protein [Tissierellia bacterium]|nr:DUF2508 family protein [Tissierellia bacterium]